MVSPEVMGLINEIEAQLRIHRLLSGKPEWQKIIKRGLSLERRRAKFAPNYSWEAWQVNSNQRTLNSMSKVGLLDRFSHISYRVNNPKLIKQVIKLLEDKND